MEMPETSTSLPDIVRDRRDTTVTPVKWTQLLPKPSLILYNNRLIAGGALNRGRAGDDDYVSKPFSPRELVARVKAILKRSAGTTASLHDLLALGALRLDRAAHSVTWSEKPIVLTALEFSVLASLLGRPDVVFTREHLMASAYGGGIHVSDRTIDSHVRNLRAKFATAGCASVVATVHGVGFKLGTLEPVL